MKRASYVRVACIALGAAVALSGLAGCPGRASGEDPDAAARAMIARYVAGWDVGGLLGEPFVAAELRSLTGDALEHLERNLDVNAGVEYYGGALTVRGNAPHQGTLEEAVICIQPFGAVPKVHAAAFSEGSIAVYTRERRYEFLPACVKDWITQVNSGHIDRGTQPKNVRLIATR